MTDDYNYIKETCVYHLTWHLMSKRVNSFVVSVTLMRRGIFSREDWITWRSAVLFSGVVLDWDCDSGWRCGNRCTWGICWLASLFLSPCAPEALRAWAAPGRWGRSAPGCRTGTSSFYLKKREEERQSQHTPAHLCSGQKDNLSLGFPSHLFHLLGISHIAHLHKQHTTEYHVVKDHIVSSHLELQFSQDTQWNVCSPASIQTCALLML